MNTITIPENEYIKLKQNILDLLKKAELFEKLYNISNTPQKLINNKRKIKPISLKRGSAKGLILYMADDFNAPLDEFKDYM